MADAETEQRHRRAETAFRRGELLLKSGDIFKAEQAFLEAVRMHPEVPEHRALLAWTKFLNPGADRAAAANIALEVLDEVLEAKPTYARAQFFRGEVWRFKKDTAKAAQAYQAALLIDPDYVDAKAELDRLGRVATSAAPATPARTPSTLKRPTTQRTIPPEAKAPPDPGAARAGGVEVISQSTLIPPPAPPANAERTRFIKLAVVGGVLLVLALAAFFNTRPSPNPPDAPNVKPGIRAL